MTNVYEITISGGLKHLTVRMALEPQELKTLVRLASAVRNDREYTFRHAKEPNMGQLPNIEIDVYMEDD